MASIDTFCLLIGAMKSGTTTLFKQLIQHPAIAAPSQKEPNYFSRREMRDRGRQWYESLWEFDPNQHAWALEASTDYTKLPGMPSAAFFAKRFQADFRFLYIVRDPLERISSQYRHGLAQGWIERPMHEEITPDAVAICNYQMQLWPYVQAFGRDRILVIDQRELHADMAGTLRDVCGFLGIDRDHAFEILPRQNAGNDFLQRGIARFLDARGLLPSLVSIDGLGKLPRRQFEDLCRGFCRDAGAPGAYAEVVREFERAVSPTPQQAEQVRALLREDLDRFRDTWGIDAWSKSNRAAIDARAAAA